MIARDANVARLVAARIFAQKFPHGFSIEDGVRFLNDREEQRTFTADAEEFARNAIAAVRAAGDPNPWRNATDEEIAAEILRAADEQKRAAHRKD